MMHALPCGQQKIRHSGNFEGKMYSRFVFPGFIKSTTDRKKSAGKENLDQGLSVSGVKHNPCVIIPSSIAMAAKTLEKKNRNWVVHSTVASDLIVQVGGSSFHLHKLPMVSRSGYLSRLVLERSNGGRDSGVKIQIDNLPGGAKAFESVVRFCYGWNVDLTSSNIAPLYCAAHFLEMGDDLEQGNLISKSEAFMSFLIFSSWKDTFRILNSCEAISLWAKELQILKRCSESIALKACTNLKDFGSRDNGANCLPEKLKVEEGADNWWFEDVSSLRIDHFIEVIQSMKTKGMKPVLVGSCIAHWTTKWLSKITFELDTPNRKNMAHQLQRVTTESLIRVLPTEENSVTCNFLLQLLKVGMVMQINSALLEGLDQRIAFMLEQCRVPDLLVKNRGGDDSVYDVCIVSRVVESYLSLASSNLGPKILAVGRLVDGYLTQVARDEKLEVKSFQSLAKALPKDARYCDDNLYRAIDMFLKAHPNTTEEERENLCKFLEYHRLSKEAREHVMKNNRVPLKIATRFILLEQVNMMRSKTTSGVGSIFQRTKSQAILRANSKSLEKGWIKFQKEIKKMTKEVETMKAQLNDLQMCKLKLLKQLKICNV